MFPVFHLEEEQTDNDRILTPRHRCCLCRVSPELSRSLWRRVSPRSCCPSRPVLRCWRGSQAAQGQTPTGSCCPSAAPTTGKFSYSNLRLRESTGNTGFRGKQNLEAVTVVEERQCRQPVVSDVELLYRSHTAQLFRQRGQTVVSQVKHSDIYNK